MKKNTRVLAILLLSLALAAGGISTVAAQEFLPYEGKNAVQEGDGGTKKVVDGVDFWADGAPPRPFKLLGCEMTLIYAVRECSACSRNVFYVAGDSPTRCPFCNELLSQTLPAISRADHQCLQEEQTNIRGSTGTNFAEALP